MAYHIDLCHCVDEDDCEDCDGETEKKRPAQVPDDATQPGIEKNVLKFASFVIF